MNRSFTTPIHSLLLACIACWLAALPSLSSRAQTNPPAGKEVAAERFDDAVRDDFFANDPVSLKRAMKTCEEALVKNPTNAPAMSWHGVGLTREAGDYFQAGDVATGLDLWKRGLKQMNDAVALQPDSLQVLVPRAATFLSLAKYTPSPNESKKMVATAVADYEKILKLQKDRFQTLPLHARGEVLSALAEGWSRLGNSEKSHQYLLRIIAECPGSDYASNAHSWLEPLGGREKRAPETLTCIGCHSR